VFLLWAPVCPLAFGAESISIISPLNGKVLELPDTPQEYSFLCAGHVYGAPESPSVFPSASFLANIDMINKNNATFFILLGDYLRAANPDYIENFKASVCSKVEIPVFNAVGNHDVTNRELYESHFGQTFFDFKHGSELFIVLDGQINNGEIVGEQLEYLKGVLDYANKSEEIKNVFIFSHNLIWSKNDAYLERTVYPHTNSHSHYENTDNFKSVVMPEIIRLSQTKKIFVISGDIGVSWSLPLFYHEDEKHNITYVACGLGDTEKDAIIKVDITGGGGEVTFEPISLTGEKLEEINHYGIDYWATYFCEQEGSAQSKLSYKIQRVLTNIYFRLGIAFSFTLIGILIAGFIFFNKLRKR
jgi:hypothetical protein